MVTIDIIKPLLDGLETYFLILSLQITDANITHIYNCYLTWLKLGMCNKCLVIYGWMVHVPLSLVTNATSTVIDNGNKIIVCNEKRKWQADTYRITVYITILNIYCEEDDQI